MKQNIHWEQRLEGTAAYRALAKLKFGKMYTNNLKIFIALEIRKAIKNLNH
jgi:hypothetical protein